MILWLNNKRNCVSNPQDLIDQIILSSNFGVGKVVGIDEMGGKEFLVVEDQQLRVKNFVSANDTDSYRLISEKEFLGKLITSIPSLNITNVYESKKDRINHFKQQAKIQDIEKIAHLIVELVQLDDRGSAEDSIKQRLLESVALEYSLVMEVSLEEANKYMNEVFIGGQNE